MSTDLINALAKDILHLAAQAGMPDSYWATDSRIVRACQALGWDHQQAREWADTALDYE